MVAVGRVSSVCHVEREHTASAGPARKKLPRQKTGNSFCASAYLPPSPRGGMFGLLGGSWSKIIVIEIITHTVLGLFQVSECTSLEVSKLRSFQ